MTHKDRTNNSYLLTLNCWSFVCLAVLLFLSLDGFSQTTSSSDSLTNLPDSSKTDSLLVDSLQLAEDFKEKVVYNAEDSIVYDIEGKKIYLYGSGSIDYEDIHLKADYIELDYETRIVKATGLPDSSGAMAGLPVFKQGEDEFKSQEMRYNFDTKKGKIIDVTTKEGESFVHGETVKKEPDNTTYIKNGYFTTCDASHPHYFIAANKLKVIPGNKVVTGPAFMTINDVPTPVAIPFGFFPNRSGRNSGIIFPAYGKTEELGFFLQNGGYYFGINDNFDLALVGDIYSKGSYRVNATSNYANRYRYNGDISMNYSLTKFSQKELPDYAEEEGFFVNWNHNQDPKAHPNSSFSARVRAGSSNFYRNNITTANNFLTNTFASSIAYTKVWAGTPFSFNSSLSHTQNTQTRDISLTLPAATFGVSRINPFKKRIQLGESKWYEKIGLSYAATFQNSIQTKDSLLFTDSSIDKFNYGLRHDIPINTSFNVAKYFTLSPFLNYSEKWYLRSIEKRYDSDADSVIIDTLSGFKANREYGFGTTLTTRVYGMVQFKKGKIAAIRHVFLPTFSYNWRPDFSESRYGNYKNVQIDNLGTINQYSIYEGSIYGGPSAGKVSSLSFNLDNIVEMKVRQETDSATNIKKLKVLESLSLSGSYNMAADSLNWSVFNLSGRTILFDRLNLLLTSSFDPYVIQSVNGSDVRVSTTELNANNRLVRFSSGNFAMNYSLLKQTKKYESQKGSQDELNQINKNPEDYYDFNIPFSLNIGYNLFYVNGVSQPDVITQTLNFNGDLQLTPNWKFNFSSGYDFTQNDISYTQVAIVRDLHCWEMRLNWVPIGFQKSYYFQINIKSSVLQDLKLSKRNDRFNTQ
jgi:lipopolysaccharide assembly outer membrane protein LptD (OstA)